MFVEAEVFVVTAGRMLGIRFDLHSESHGRTELVPTVVSTDVVISEYQNADGSQQIPSRSDLGWVSRPFVNCYFLFAIRSRVSDEVPRTIFAIA